MAMTYKASDLREWIEVLALVKVPDGGGGYSQQWLPLSPPVRVPAMVHPRSSRERFMGGETASTEQILVVIRYVKGLKGEMRLKYGTRTLSVLGVVDVEERHAWLEIETEEQYGE